MEIVQAIGELWRKSRFSLAFPATLAAQP